MNLMVKRNLLNAVFESVDLNLILHGCCDEFIVSRNCETYISWAPPVKLYFGFWFEIDPAVHNKSPFLLSILTTMSISYQWGLTYHSTSCNDDTFMIAGGSCFYSRNIIFAALDCRRIVA